MKNHYLPTKYEITDYWKETDDNFTIRVNAGFRHEPGQFVQVSCLGIGECPISISSYSEDHLDLNIHVIGNVTSALSGLKKGDFVFIRGPFGKGYPMHYLKGNSLVIIGGGCGVAPLRGIIEYIDKNRDDFSEVMLFLGYRSPEDILFRNSLEEWKKNYNVTVSVDKKSDNPEACYLGKIGFVTQALDEYKMDNSNKVAFVCGPPVMMKKSVEILKKKGFNDDQIFISAERLMYCGIGKCCHCMIHGKFTCKDGPVFRYDEISKFKND